jgi:hypothetical protein
MATNFPAAVQVRSRVRVRTPGPTTSADIASRIEPGAVLHPVAEVDGEAVAGNGRWYEIADQQYVWSGACAPMPSGVSPPSSPPHSHLTVLSLPQIEAEFGRFTYVEGTPRGAIAIDRAWVRANLTEIATPMLTAVGHSRLTVHRKAADALLRALGSIKSAGLLELILTCDGTWVARHKTWNPARSLSPHSWGIAIDLNARWNGYGVQPPALGHTGSVRELIPYFEAEQFAWGGYFSDPDGMHFEYTRTGN